MTCRPPIFRAGFDYEVRIVAVILSVTYVFGLTNLYGVDDAYIPISGTRTLNSPRATDASRVAGLSTMRAFRRSRLAAAHDYINAIALKVAGDNSVLRTGYGVQGVVVSGRRRGYVNVNYRR